MSLKNTILSITRRTKRGFTVNEIFNRVNERFTASGQSTPLYSSVRARVYELANSGSLVSTSARADSSTGRTAKLFRRSASSAQ
jgi:hypothetical protein